MLWVAVTLLVCASAVAGFAVGRIDRRKETENLFRHLDSLSRDALVWMRRAEPKECTLCGRMTWSAWRNAETFLLLVREEVAPLAPRGKKGKR